MSEVVPALCLYKGSEVDNTYIPCDEGKGREKGGGIPIHFCHNWWRSSSYSKILYQRLLVVVSHVQSQGVVEIVIWSGICLCKGSFEALSRCVLLAWLGTCLRREVQAGTSFRPRTKIRISITLQLSTSIKHGLF
jgi:hypothetical protein